MGHWEWGGYEMADNPCRAVGTLKSNTSASEPFFEASNEAFDCTYMRIRINGQLYNNQPYGFYPGTQFKHYVPDPGEAGKFDCLNGNCTPSDTGYFQSLADCQAVCAYSCGEGKQCVDPNNFCPPGKICIDSSEYSQIEALINKISQEICG